MIAVLKNTHRLTRRKITMLHKIIAASFLALISTSVLIAPAKAQVDQETARLLQRANQVGSINSSFNQPLIRQATIQGQNNTNQLNYYLYWCNRGYTQACQQYQILSNYRIQQYNSAISQYNAIYRRP
jgi:hypothetical protein